jgi:hypothetical protein
MWKIRGVFMPKIELRIEIENCPLMRTTRDVKTVKDLQRLFRDASQSLAKAARVFSEVTTAKVKRLSVGGK